MNQKPTFLSLLVIGRKIPFILFLLSLLSGKIMAQQTLYAIDGYNAPNAMLYKLNVSNGSIVAVVGNTGLTNVTNMAVDPISGQIYVQASHAVDSQLVSGQMEYLWQGFLYIVDSLTGVPTQVDTTTDTTTLDLLEPPYLIFSPAGNMYQIDLVCHCVRDQIGVSFDNICHLFYKDEFNLIDIDTSTGEFLSFASINGVADNMFSVDINDNFYSGQRISGGFILKTIDKFSGFVSFVGTNTIENMAAIAFGPYRPVMQNANSIIVCSGTAAALVSPVGDTYQWKLNGTNIPTATSQTYMATQPGNYIVEIAIGCGKYPSSATTVSHYPSLVLTTAVSNVSCFGFNNGSIDLSVTGAAASDYLWNNSSTTQDISNLPPGTYSVSVTDVNSCVVNTYAVITQPLLGLSAVSGGQTNATSGNNGSATVLASGGTPSYTYHWHPTGGNNATATGLGAGTYTVTVTDAKGCTAQQMFTITQMCNVAFSGVITNVSCNGNNNGAIDVTITSGPGTYAYSWSNGATTQDLTNRSAGVYTLTVSSTTGCGQTQSFTITQPAPINIATATTNVSCYDSQNGAIDITVIGGTPPYTYTWADVNSGNLLVWLFYYYGQWCNSNNTGWPGSNIHTQDRINLDNGCYYVKVTDANGCSSIANVTIYQPSPMCVSYTKSNAGCSNNNGVINQSVSGGTAPYTYQWSNGATTQSVTGLSAGNYSVVITDAHGCTENRSYSISQATANITVTANKTNAICTSNTGSINISVSGGSSPYTYIWSNGLTTQDIYNIAAGNYTVNITDANGCVKIQSYSISSTSGNICVSVTKTNANCANTNGNINISVSGGTAPYSYQWSNGATTQDISSLSSGSYTVNITDANGCSSAQTYTIGQSSGNLSAGIGVSPQYTVSGQQAYTIFIGYGAQSVTLSASVSGGTAPYSRQWSSTSSTNSSVTVSPTTTTVYTLTVTDANGCIATATRTIIVKDVQAPNGKIYVCHNGTSTAVSQSQVNTHLCHGDDLGQCLPNNNCRTAGGSDQEAPEPKESVIEQVPNKLNFNVYPNPTNGAFIIDIPSIGDVEIIITDGAGRVVERKVIRNNTEQHLQFDMQNAARGIYMVRVIADGEAYQSKITLQ
jgi:hypothetical protein